MTTLSLIGEPFPDHEALAHAAAARCLAEALAESAPRGCASRLLIARDSPVPEIRVARASVEAVPINRDMLPVVWRSGLAAKPLDGEFTHANTPLVPLRSRIEDDGSQTSVMIPHTLAWDAPELMGGPSVAKRFKSFTKRAIKLADAVLAPTHAVADRLTELYGAEVQVLTLAAPREYLAADDSAGTRAELGLPEHYVATTAGPGDNGRLSWLLDAMEVLDALPPLVVLHFGSEQLPPVRDSLTDRVHLVQVSDLRDAGAVLSAAMILALPQRVLGTGFEVLGALENRVPILHAGCDAVTEIALDAAVSTASEQEFVEALIRLTSTDGARELHRLRLFADDRAPSFHWHMTAWQLWELHANL